MKEKISFCTLVSDQKVKYEKRWKPYTISYIESYFKNGMLVDMPVNIRKNIAYNYQYLEYMSYQLETLTLNSAIENSLYKNYIIIGSSIIEAIFYWLIKHNNLNSKNEKKLLYTAKSNKLKYNGREIIIETNVYKKIEPVDTEMTYDSMIKKIESKHILDITHKAYPYIKKFRKLRNRVHLQVSDEIGNTEWWAFNRYDYYLMKYILLIILLDENIRGNTKNADILYFLNLTETEKIFLKNYINKKEKS